MPWPCDRVRQHVRQIDVLANGRFDHLSELGRVRGRQEDAVCLRIVCELLLQRQPGDGTVRIEEITVSAIDPPDLLEYAGIVVGEPDDVAAERVEVAPVKRLHSLEVAWG